MSIPFSPSVYEHAAALIGERPWTVSRDAGLLADAHQAAWELYRHAPVVVGTDIYNLEAEAYGAVVAEPAGNGIPAIVEPLWPGLPEGPLPVPDPATAGRLALVIAVGRELRRRLPAADVRIPVSGPFSIATSLLGANLFLECALRPAATAAFLRALVAGQVSFCRAIHAAGLGLALFESAAAPPLLAPRQFRELVLPALRELVEAVAALTGRRLPCIIGGDTTPILPDLLATGAGYVICPAETDQRAFLAALAGRDDVTVRVNLDPGLVSRGTPSAILAGVDAILALIGHRPNTCLGTGAVPYETPPENILLIRDYVA